MDTIFTDTTIGVSELRQSPSRALQQIAESNGAIAILNHNKPAGYLVSPALMAAMLDDVSERIAIERARIRLGELAQARKISID